MTKKFEERAQDALHKVLGNFLAWENSGRVYRLLGQKLYLVLFFCEIVEKCKG